MSKTMTWAAAVADPPLYATLLHLLAAALRTASDLLSALALRLAAEKDVATPALQTMEFHALHRDAGAPEGALYINGEFVGVIEGVKRL